MSNLLNKLFNGSMEKDDEYDDMYDRYEPEYDDEYDDYEEQPVYEAKNIININGDDKSTLVIVEPKTIQDACTIVQLLKENKMCVGKFDLSNPAEVQNIVDFVTGAVYALNADMEKISEEIFVVVPGSVQIKKTQKEEIRQSMGTFSFRKNK